MAKIFGSKPTHIRIVLSSRETSPNEVFVEAEDETRASIKLRDSFETDESGNRYRVYNVAVEGASLVTVYRNQFGETIKSKGIDGLIAELKAKNGSK